MTKLVLILGLVGVGILALGIRFQSPRNRQLGLTLLGVATILTLLSQVGHISIFPSPTLAPSPTPSLAQPF